MEKELILKIITAALEINSKVKNTVFIIYYGHVDAFEIHIHTQGWKRNEKPDYSKSIYMNTEYTDAKKELTEVLEYLNKIKENL